MHLVNLKPKLVIISALFIISKSYLRLVFTSDGVGVGVIIKSIELYDLVKRVFWFLWFCLWVRCSWSRENWVVIVTCRSARTKPITKHGNVHCDWFSIPFLFPNPMIWFSLDDDHERNISDRNVSRKTFWIFWPWFSWAYDSVYDYDSLTSENQPLKLHRKETSGNKNLRPHLGIQLGTCTALPCAQKAAH